MPFKSMPTFSWLPAVINNHSGLYSLYHSWMINEKKWAGNSLFQKWMLRQLRIRPMIKPTSSFKIPASVALTIQKFLVSLPLASIYCLMRLRLTSTPIVISRSELGAKMASSQRWVVPSSLSSDFDSDSKPMFWLRSKLESILGLTETP